MARAPHSKTQAEQPVDVAGAERVSAAVTRIFYDKGFGFVQPDGQDAEAFMHKSAFESRGAFDRLKPGGRVTCVIQSTSKGLRAIDVQVVGG